MDTKHVTVSLALAALSLPFATAQVPNPRTRSLESGLPAAVSYRNANTTVVGEPTYIIPYQTSTTVSISPLGDPKPGTADFRNSIIFGDNADVAEIDGMAVGSAMVPPLRPDGTFDLGKPGAGQWMSLTGSVSGDSTGTATSFTRRRMTAPAGRNNPGADLLTYVMLGSQGLASQLLGSTLVSRTAEDVGLGGAGVEIEYDALDLNIGVLAENSFGPTPAVFFRPALATDFFFSLTPQSCAAFVDESRYLFGEHRPDPATIYRVRWTAGTPGSWGPIEIYLSASTLGLTAPGEDIDALDVDRDRNIVIYSTQRVIGRSQLRVYGQTTNGTIFHGDLMDGGQSVVERMQLNDGRTATSTSSSHDDIRTVCIRDPELWTVSPYYGFWKEFPGSVEPGTPMIGCAASRYREAGNDFLVLNVSGGSPGDMVDPSALVGHVTFLVAAPYDPRNPWYMHTWEASPPLLRTPNDVTFVHELQVPSGVGSIGIIALFQPFIGGPLQTSYVTQIEL